MTWKSGVPDNHGYYLGAWRRAGRLVVSELWFNPDATPQWWTTRGYTGERKRHPMDGAIKQGVIAWMLMPEPPEWKEDT